MPTTDQLLVALTLVSALGCGLIAGVFFAFSAFVMKALSRLNLSNTRLTDHHLEHVRDLTGLQSLDLSGTEITDNSFKRLRELRRLQFLDLRGTKVSESVVDDLKKSLPKCSILWEPVPTMGLQ